MHERGGLERVPRLLAGHLRAGELAEFGIDEREQSFWSLRVAILNRIEKIGNVRHVKHYFSLL